MAVIQAVDVHALFLFLRDLNGHHQEWSSSTIMNCLGVAALDFCNYQVVIYC